MFKKLHLQMTLFCTLITGMIMISMSVINIVSSESSLQENAYISFQNDAASMVASLENQTVISYEWISRMEKNGRYLISISNNGYPLLYDQLNRTEEGTRLLKKASKLVFSEYAFEPSSLSQKGVLTSQVFYILHENGKEQFYVTAANIPKNNRSLEIFVVYSLKSLHQQIFDQRILFLVLNLLGLVLLFIFSWFFTRKMIAPLKRSREQQIQFVASASHELRTPLTVILSSLSAMDKASEEGIQRFKNIITSEGMRMSRLVDDLLTLAKADNLKFEMRSEPVELDTLLLNTVEKFEPLAGQKHIHISISLPDETLAPYTGDYGRLEQVISILLDNAVSYTPEGGRIQLSLLIQQARFEIKITDNGPGIPNESKDIIWDRFSRLDKSHTDRKHFGLGLPIAKEIVKNHKGKIWVEDAVDDTGAVFIVSLPCR